MGHWADLLVDELATRFPHADRDRPAALVQEAGTEIETLTGLSFGPAKQNSVSINTFGLPNLPDRRAVGLVQGRNLVTDPSRPRWVDHRKRRQAKQPHGLPADYARF